MNTIGDGTNAASKAVAALKDTPLWLFIGLAVATDILLFVPTVTAELTIEIRRWVVVGAVLFNVLAIIRLTDLCVNWLNQWRKARTKRRKFHLSADNAQCNWSTHRQPDDSMTTQISVRGLIKNLTDAPLGFAEPRLIKPRIKGEVLNAHLMIAGRRGYGTTLHSGYRIPSNTLAAASIDIIIRGVPSRAPTADLFAVLGIVDDEGDERDFKVTLKGRRPSKPLQPEIPLERAFSITDPIEKEIVSILQSEMSRYDKHGRERGAFGSIHIVSGGKIISGFGQDGWNPDSPTNQSIADEPDKYGIGSDNLGALSALFGRLSTDDERSTFATALLERLGEDRGYLRVSYFIVCALWKAGHLEEALQGARKLPENDRRSHGLSNVLYMLNGLLRYRHPDFTAEMLDQIESLVHDLRNEHTFQILEKISAIRAVRLSTP